MIECVLIRLTQPAEAACPTVPGCGVGIYRPSLLPRFQQPMGSSEASPNTATSATGLHPQAAGATSSEQTLHSVTAAKPDRFLLVLLNVCIFKK